jgi:hypothetical protein
MQFQAGARTTIVFNFTCEDTVLLKPNLRHNVVPGAAGCWKFGSPANTKVLKQSGQNYTLKLHIHYISRICDMQLKVH